jgi:DNA-binding transcriptional LysR family regulator
MDYRQIELFIAIAERLNISQAAEAMRITQPGLSKSMTRLQKELGTKLYHRRGRGIELTESGIALLRHGKKLETQLAAAHNELTGIATGSLGHIRIGAGPSWLSKYLPDSIAAIIKRHPKLHFTVKADFPNRLIAQLRSGELDIVIAALPENRSDPDLRFMRLSSDTVLVIARQNHPLFAKANRDISDFRRYGWILPGKHEALRRRVEKAFRDAGLGKPDTILESDSLSMIFATLRLTDCLSVLASQSLSLSEARGIVALDHEHLRFFREAGIIIRREGNPSTSVRILTAELRRIAAKKIRN